MKMKYLDISKANPVLRIPNKKNHKIFGSTMGPLYVFGHLKIESLYVCSYLRR